MSTLETTDYENVTRTIPKLRDMLTDDEGHMHTSIRTTIRGGCDQNNINPCRIDAVRESAADHEWNEPAHY